MNILIPLAGGVMIGVAAVAMLLFLGRITGVSGIFFNAMMEPKGGNWRWMFLGGLLLGPLLVLLFSGAEPPTPNRAGVWIIVLAGFLVGFGTHLGSGCTSGHGVCGIGRLSKRSIVATLAFMGAGILTVYVVRHLLAGQV